jgi:hypothetical protein
MKPIHGEKRASTSAAESRKKKRAFRNTPSVPDRPALVNKKEDKSGEIYRNTKEQKKKLPVRHKKISLCMVAVL